MEEPGLHEKLPVVMVDYNDFQDVQVIHDRLIMAKYILSSNIQIGEKIHLSLPSNSTANMLLDELRAQLIRVGRLSERTRNGSGLVSDQYLAPFLEC